MKAISGLDDTYSYWRGQASVPRRQIQMLISSGNTLTTNPEIIFNLGTQSPVKLTHTINYYTYQFFFSFLSHLSSICTLWGIWVPQSVKRLTLALGSGHDLIVLSSSPASALLSVQSLLGMVSPSFSTSTQLVLSL